MLLPRLGVLLIVAAAPAACGGGAGQASPTPVPATSAAPAARATASAAPSRLPVTFDPAAVAAALPGLDPDYVRALVYVNAVSGEQQRQLRWIGGPMHHCLGAGVPLQLVADAAALVAELTGIGQTSDGPCNVTWSRDYAPGHTFANPHAGPDGIVAAEIVLHHEGAQEVRHELGHVLGLGHSTSASDLMNLTPRADTFSPDERRVLGAMYGR